MKRLVNVLLLATAVAAAVLPAIPVRVGWCRMTGPLESMRFSNVADRACICCPPAKTDGCCAGSATGAHHQIDSVKADVDASCSCFVSVEVKGTDAPASVRSASTPAADVAYLADAPAFAALDAIDAAPALPASLPPGAPPPLRVHLRI